MTAPITMDASELMMRLRSSVRCSKKVMAPAGSSACGVIGELESDSGTDSGRVVGVIGSFSGTLDCGGSGLGFGRIFRGTRNGFGNRRDYRVFGGTGCCLRLGRGGLYAGRRRGWCSLSGLGSGRSDRLLSSLFARRLEGLALHFPPFFF